MAFSREVIDELDLLLKFPSESLMQGLKIHHDASQSIVEASARLYAKGLITQVDGGYLTELGVEVVDHLRRINSAMTVKFN